MHYGLVGHPLSHSFSKAYFESRFKSLHLDGYAYSNIDLGDLSLLKNEIADRHLSGFNVTIPYKEHIMPLLDQVDSEASAIGAVNCVKVDWKDTGFTLTGYNTDHYGFAQSIKPFLEPVHNKALVLGTGGSSKAVAYALEKIGVEVYFVTGGEKKGGNYFFYDELNAYVLEAFRLIVNTTPLGMYPETDQCPAIPYQYLSAQHLLYDLVYNPEETVFLKKGKEQGAVTINGLNMLRLQADKSWEIWTGA